MKAGQIYQTIKHYNHRLLNVLVQHKCSNISNLSLYDIIFSFKHRPPAGPYKIYILVPMLNHFVYANIKLHILLIKSLTIATAEKFDEASFQVFSSIVRFARAVEVYAVRAKINFLPFRQFEVEFTN